jgi:MHS family proline/betaine transporter-like MFS transporter
LLRAFVISSLGSITYYVGITYVPAFLSSAGAMSEAAALWLSTIAAVAVILVTPIVGLISDRFGRKPALLALAGLSAVLPISMFSLMAGGATARALFGATVLALVAGGVSAVSEAQLQAWGWRVPYLVGAALAATVWLARSTMEESPDFERLRANGELPPRP